MSVAYNLIREQPHYRRDAFNTGLASRGYQVRMQQPTSWAPGDVLLMWNRHIWHKLASSFESSGGKVLVAENGYVGKGGISPHSMKVRDPYALARSWHNDAGAIADGGAERWEALGVDLQPWRQDGRHILVCPNRPFGAPGRVMEEDWARDVKRRLAALTKREIRVRPHPGNSAPEIPLAEDLAGAWAVVIWGSSAGVHALLAGIPVICEAPYWICKSATGRLPEIEQPPMGDRLSAMRRLARGQYFIAEIASGEAFRGLA